MSKTLGQIFAFLQCSPPLPVVLREQKIEHITLDARQADAQTLFVAVAGSQRHGAEFLGQLHPQTPAVLCDDDFYLETSAANVLVIGKLKQRLGALAHWFYDQPSTQCRLIGVTGTNGKTSVTHYLAQLAKSQGVRLGIMGTLGYGVYGENLVDTGNTTTDVLSSHRIVRSLLDQGCAWVAMEVSSHAIHQQRIASLVFAARLLTNVTRDHLDYHQTLANYQATKAQFMLEKSPGLVIFNGDDPVSAPWPWPENALAYGLQSPQAQWQLLNHQQDAQGQRGVLQKQDEVLPFSTGLYGNYHLSNLLAAWTLVKHWLPQLSAKAFEHISPVKGRLERICQQPQVFVDYAHTPDAIHEALQALRDHFPHQKIWIIFGAGGNRDPGKRPLMAQAAESLADHLIITNDNPRHEDPLDIAMQVLAGLSHSQKAQIILDRQSAIERVLNQMDDTQVLLIAGKGHEDYQIFGDDKRYFSDHDVVNNWRGDRITVTSDPSARRTKRSDETYQLDRRQSEHRATQQSGRAVGYSRFPEGRMAEDSLYQHLLHQGVLPAVKLDHRQVRPGDIFIALQGARFDAHDFAKAALEMGAAWVIVERDLALGPQSLRVESTLAALQQLAFAQRQAHRLHQAWLVNGSNGKTTSKTLLGALMNAAKPTLVTQGNLNNHIGLPQMLLRLQPQHQAAVLELGANAQGEIAQLAPLAQPSGVLITNAQGAHLKGFGSLENIRHAKGEALPLLGARGLAVLNGDDEAINLWRSLAAPAGILTFGKNPKADIQLLQSQHQDAGTALTLATPWGRESFFIPLWGEHNALNFAAAAAAAAASGVSFAQMHQALSSLDMPQGRLALKKIHGLAFLDDTYNANPASVAAGLSTLCHFHGKKALWLGPLAELGDEEIPAYSRLGKLCKDLEIAWVGVSHGRMQPLLDAFGGEGVVAPSPIAVAQAFAQKIAAASPGHAGQQEDWIILVKGSRSAQMEQALSAWEEIYAHTA